MREVVIVSGVRTAQTKYGGAFKDIHPAKLSAIVIKEAIKRANISTDMVERIYFGNVIQTSEAPNVARLAVLYSGLPVTTPATTLNIQCGSGLEAINQCARSIMLGEGDIMVAGGVEIMSRSPYLMYNHRWGHKMGNDTIIDYFHDITITVSSDLYGVFGMAETAEKLAKEYKISRKDQDEFSLNSHMKAVKAINEGKFKKEIVPVEISQPKGGKVIIDTDEHPRSDTSMERLSKLKPAFRTDGTVTAGNASGINDGAAALVIMSRDKGKELGIKPMARIVSFAQAGVHPTVMGIGPVPATERALKNANLKIDDIDLIELNEAFAAQALAVIKAFPFDINKVNVNGGAVALGHPVGCSGSRIMVTLLHEMERRNSKYGLATLCCGGGLGVSTIVERI
jgi:acetyl-CoA C-acetyltransferase